MPPSRSKLFLSKINENCKRGAGSKLVYLLAADANHDLYQTDQLLCRFQVLDQALKVGFSESDDLGAGCCSCLQDVYGPVMRQSSFADGNILSPCLSTSCYWNNWGTCGPFNPSGDIFLPTAVCEVMFFVVSQCLSTLCLDLLQCCSHISSKRLQCIQSCGCTVETEEVVTSHSCSSPCPPWSRQLQVRGLSSVSSRPGVFGMCSVGGFCAGYIHRDFTQSPQQEAVRGSGDSSVVGQAGCCWECLLYEHLGRGSFFSKWDSEPRDKRDSARLKSLFGAGGSRVMRWEC